MLGKSKYFTSDALINYASKQALLKNALKARYDTLGTVYTPPENSFEGDGAGSGNLVYFYHADHLGSSSQITNADGAVMQHVEYVPFGEVFIEERNNTWNTPYLFNAKELDEETGLYYYGARYYEPRTSVWLSVDPLAEKYYSISPYAWCGNNPINYFDPDGRNGLAAKIRQYYQQASTWAANNPQVMTRVDGAFKVATGLAEGVAGLATSYSGWGAMAFSHGVDVGGTGINQLITGEFQNTTTSGTLQQAGVSPEIADGIDMAVGAVASLGTSLTMNAAKTIPATAAAISNTGFSVNPTKFDYFFGRVTTGNSHNIARSAQNLKDLTTLGVKNEGQLMNVFDQALKSGPTISTKTTQYGTTVMRSVNVGNKGKINVGFFYEGGNMASKPSVTTIIPEIFN